MQSSSNIKASLPWSRQDILGCDRAIMGLWPVLGDQVVCVVVGVVLGVVVGVVGDQLVGVEGDEAGPGYCGQGLLHASHSLPLRLLSGPSLFLSLA